MTAGFTPFINHYSSDDKEIAHSFNTAERRRSPCYECGLRDNNKIVGQEGSGLREECEKCERRLQYLKESDTWG